MVKYLALGLLLGMVGWVFFWNAMLHRQEKMAVESMQAQHRLLQKVADTLPDGYAVLEDGTVLHVGKPTSITAYGYQTLQHVTRGGHNTCFGAACDPKWKMPFELGQEHDPSEGKP